MTVHVIPAPWSEFREKLQQIRSQVFIEEQGVAKEIERDGLDGNAHHFLAVNELAQYIGCARLLSNGQIGRMAVLSDQRGLGIGALLLNAAVSAAKELGFEQVFLHAQSQAEGFYRKGGFLPNGPRFLEAGIEHVNMTMNLPLTFTSSIAAVTPVNPFGVK